MKTNQPWRFIPLLALPFLSSCSVDSNHETCLPTNKLSANYDPAIDSLVKKLTLEEKSYMLHGNSLFSSGGNKRLGLPGLYYTDGPHGIREEVGKTSWEPVHLTTDSATFLPVGTALAATWNTGLAYDYGTVLGNEARARDKDIVLGPAVNIMRTPLCGRNFEYFTEDPLLNAGIAVGYIKGVQSKDVGACIKHYAVNNQETNRGRIDVYMSERALREIYLPVYKAAVQEAGVYAVMGAYNKFRGQYLCENDYLLNKVLKQEWGFKGIVVSDWHATHSTVDAALNGLDVEMGTNKTDFNDFYFADALIDSVKAGVVPEEVVDDKVKRIMRVMYHCKNQDSTRNQGAIRSAEHSDIVYNVASEAITLLKNTESALPLDLSKIKSIAVIGDNAMQTHAQGGFSAGVKTHYEITPLEGLKNRMGNNVQILHARGYKKTTSYIGRQRIENLQDALNDTLINEAIDVAKKADIVLFIGGTNHHYETEAVDKPDLKLPYLQDSLLQIIANTNPNIVSVIIAGGPVDLSVVNSLSKSVLYAWLNGSEAGNALADVLLGKVNPSGKLPFTIPQKLDDSPAHALNAFPGENLKTTYLEDVLVGYRWFETKNIPVQYCFGHGLSYTSFGYDKLEFTNNECSGSGQLEFQVVVTNTGIVKGKEVVQVYFNDLESTVLRPAKELLTFKKVEVLPGEKETVHFKVDASELAFYDEEMKEWNVEPGKYQVMIGSSVQDIRLTEVIEIQ